MSLLWAWWMVHIPAHLSVLYARRYQLLEKLCLTCSPECWPVTAERRRRGDKERGEIRWMFPQVEMKLNQLKPAIWNFLIQSLLWKICYFTDHGNSSICHYQSQRQMETSTVWGKMWFYSTSQLEFFRWVSVSWGLHLSKLLSTCICKGFDFVNMTVYCS